MARNTKPTSDEFNYKVEQLPLYRGGSAVKVGGSPVMGNFRTDNGVCLLDRTLATVERDQFGRYLFLQQVNHVDTLTDIVAEI